MAIAQVSNIAVVHKELNDLRRQQNNLSRAIAEIGEMQGAVLEALQRLQPSPSDGLPPLSAPASKRTADSDSSRSM